MMKNNIDKLTQQWNEEETNKEHPHLGSMNLNPEAIRREYSACVLATGNFSGSLRFWRGGGADQRAA